MNVEVSRSGAVESVPMGVADFVSLYLANVDSVYNVSFRVVWNHFDALDVTQTAFVRLFTKRGQLRDLGRVRPWLLQIAYRESIAIVRARREQPCDPSDLPESVSIFGCPAEEVMLAHTRAAVQAAIAGLPQRLRAAIVLRDIEGLSVADTASILGTGESATKMRIARGREALRVSLGGRGQL